MSEELFQAIYDVIEPIVSSADPAALGGARGEYDRETVQICRHLMQSEEPIKAATIRELFLSDFPDCNVLSIQEAEELAASINAHAAKVKAGRL